VSASKTLVGYCEPFSAAPGERIRLMVSSEVPGSCGVDVVRLRCGDPHRGLDEVPVDEAPVPPAFAAREQPIRPGSHAIIGPYRAIDELGSFRVGVRARASLPGDGRVQSLVATWDVASERGWALYIDDAGVVRWRVGSSEVALGARLPRGRWVQLEAGVELDADTDAKGGVVEVGSGRGRLWLRQSPLPSRSPGADLVEREVRAAAALEGTRAVGRPVHGGGSGDGAGATSGRPLLLGAWWGSDGEPAAHYDGRLEAPEITDGGSDLVARWDFSRDIGTAVVHDAGPLGLHGRTEQCPARAVTGSTWDGSTQRWTDDASQYAAIHFHHDDLVDAGWATDAEFVVPADLASGLYCFRVAGPDGEVDRTPFVVRPPDGVAGADVLFLVPTATYLAYANHRMTIDGSDFFPARNRLRPEFQYVRDHPEVGLSMYEYHADGSGVMYSSRRRPVLNLKPGADGWAFTADTNLVAFLEEAGHGFDVATDEDLHRQGADLLRRYRVVVTGSHPEYFSTVMLDAVEQFLAAGGRLMYLGGNGFYWRVAFHPDHPGVMELRRAEDGTRGWIAEPGEYYHEWGAEYGGLWRRLGRPPNLLVGIGFAAQGFDRAAPYKRTEASFASRAAWVFEGVESDEIVGDYGVGRGAAGQEIDRYDERLGSPPHAVILAYADEHSEQMLRTKEELLATRAVTKDPKIRADMVFFECPNGGAVFSVGSIAWFGALGHRGGDNDIARITTNVLRRFVDPAPFPPPAEVPA
jgi:N,N-dimethylformamidase